MKEARGLYIDSFPLFTLGYLCKDFLLIKAHFLVELGRPSSITLSANKLQSSEIIVDF